MFWTTVYKPSQRVYEGVTDLEYPFREKEKRINGHGDIVLSRKVRIFVSTVLVGQLVGLTEGDDGIGKVTFMDYDIGCFDEDDYKFNPLDKQSTMCSIQTVNDVSGCTILCYLPVCLICKGLYLSNNDLESLPEGLFSLHGLNLDDNQLASLPEGIFSHLTSLWWLRLDASFRQDKDRIISELGRDINIRF